MHAVLSPTSGTPPHAAAPVAAVLAPLDGSAPHHLTLWHDPAQAATERSRTGGRSYEVEEVLGHGARGADGVVASLTEFDGPRDAAQVAADRLSSQRIWAAVSQVPGVLGAVVLRASDGGMAIIAMADSAVSLDSSVRTLLSTPLLPEEDPALLSGPSRAIDCRLTGAGLVDLITAGVPA